MKKPRHRQACAQCNTVHNKIKNAPNGCDRTKKLGAKILPSSTSNKKQKRGPPSTSSSSENDEESEQGEIFIPDPDEVLSRESSSWEGSKSSDSDTASVSSTLRRTNIVNEHINDISLSEGDSSASFHDDSSYESSVEDDMMPDLYDDTDDDKDESDGDPDSEEDDEPTWTEEELAAPNSGKFKSDTPAFPKFKPVYTPGPSNIPIGTENPIDFLNLYLDCSIIDEFVKHTNIFGEELCAFLKKKSKSPHQGSWKPTNRSEIYRLFGVLLHMGMKRQPSMRCYWSNDPRFTDPFVKKCFTRDRFEMLKKCLHVIHIPNLFPSELKQRQKDDCFWRVSPFLDHLCLMYMRFYVCNQDIDIDEMCIGFKGRHVARCYNPNKPEKWHLKAFCLNDSTTGYLHGFYMYQGLQFYIFFNSPN